MDSSFLVEIVIYNREHNNNDSIKFYNLIKNDNT